MITYEDGVSGRMSGNRRSGYNVFEKMSGAAWGQVAISTAKWGGVRLANLLKKGGMVPGRAAPLHVARCAGPRPAGMGMTITTCS